MKNNKYQVSFIVFLLGILLGLSFVNFSGVDPVKFTTADDLIFNEQEATVRAIKRVMPSVVSIVVYKDKITSVYNQETDNWEQNNDKTQIGSGTGFIISSDGLILTNKHVINSGDDLSYRIILNDNKEYYASLIDKDPINDLAVLKVYDKNLPYVELGDSDSLQIGQSVVAIGNSLGLYKNSATKGIVSALGRNIVASDHSGNSENLDNVIQTDAEINTGNSGGPLIDLNGRVIGVNSAVDTKGTAIGFSIPINSVRPVINSVRDFGIIKRPRLGVRYLMITPEIFQDKNLSRSEGALIIEGEDGEVAIMPDSAAEEAGLKKGDIIFEINAIKVEGKNTLISIIQKYKPGDKIGLKIQRDAKIIIKELILGSF